MRYVVLLAALVLTGCGTTREVEVIRTVEVKVPLPVPCDIEVVENDVDIAPMINSAANIHERADILTLAYGYVTAQRDAERAARKACNTPAP